MRRTVQALSLVLVTAAAGSGIAVASARPARVQTSTTVLHTTAKLTFAHTFDIGQHGRSAGDITTFGGRLTGPDLNGHYQASCVNVTRSAQECTETLSVPGGAIAAQAAYGSGSTALTPIVGGSGRYLGTRGDMTEREINGGRAVRLVLRLEH